MPGLTTKNPKKRAGNEKRTPVHIDPEVYVEMRRLAVEQERPVARVVNRALRVYLDTLR